MEMMMGQMQRRKRLAKMGFPVPRSLPRKTFRKVGKDLVRSLRRATAAMLAFSEALGPDFEAVWDANNDKLYEP